MKVSKWFDSTFEMIIYITIFIFLILCFIFVGTRDYTSTNVTDSKKFVNEHKMVDENNVFEYLTASEVFDYIKEENAVVLFGKKNNEWVNKYANILNEVAKEVGIDKIYYYDITEDKANENGTYQAITEYLENYITYLDDDSKNIYVPAFLVKKDNIIIFYDDQTAVREGNITIDEYWNNYNINLTKENLKVVLTDYMESTNE